ncbi:MAG: diphosphate--fructose-6-phosphate 1-phosphotransferase [Spirochaetaceae bacterium]|jgi:pyrophosphate--fructose-6-phosphate 1-phosphotransferase|nr:diphosphate--fructose-6-phosphate 1-phosphotransferase [Spirochaetaceae bacterium]
MELSALQLTRYQYRPTCPRVLAQDLTAIDLALGEPTESLADQEALKALFKHTYGQALVQIVNCTGESTKNLGRKRTVGVILSGGQAPGGHNVIAGLYDGLKRGNRESRLYGFLGGPSGLIENKAQELTDAIIDAHRNTGGFDMIGSGRTKIETAEQFAASLKTAKQLQLDAVVIIGGDDSNTNAALLAEYFLSQGSSIQVVGCPKTIDGDLKNEYIEASFGFDTAVKTYSELIGNIERDVNSAKKYWHFIKLMGRSASHIALECALQTHPNVCFISEEVAHKQWSLSQVVDQICDSVVKRAAAQEPFGVVLIPEGLVEFIPEMKKLIQELNDTLAAHTGDALSQGTDPLTVLGTKLSKEARELLESLPKDIARQLLMDRDPHGNVQVSRIETDKLLISMVEQRLRQLKEQGRYNGQFSALGHFFGYEGRAAFPSNFDANYGYSLGLTAFVLIAAGLTGYMASVRNLADRAEDWAPGGVPLTMLMHLEQRHGAQKPVIQKALVDLNAAPFKAFAAARDIWAVTTSFLFPGSIQYFGPPELCDRPPKTLELERKCRTAPERGESRE